jgi:hypothetical protein
MGCPVVGVPDSQEPQSGTLYNRAYTWLYIIRGFHDLPLVYGVGTRTAEKIGQPRNLNRKALGYLGSRGLSGF